MAGKPQGRSLSLFVPGLFGPHPDSFSEAAPATPALETLLSRADAVPAAVRGFEATIFDLFGMESPDDGDLPIAAVTRALDMGVIDKGWWLRADPVHLRPDRDRLILVDTQLTPLTQDEANRLAAEILESYAEDGWVLKAPRPGRWYLKPPRAARIQTTPLSDVIGRDIHPYLPKGKDGKLWHTTLNEMQILLHTAAVNVEREQRGELPINSLWFWGSGRLPEIRRVSWAHVHSAEPVSLALARLAEVPSSARPSHYGDWQEQALPSGSHLVILDQLHAAVQYHDYPQWRELMERLDNEWMAPIFGALKHRDIVSMTIHTDHGRAFQISARHARRWWRFPRSLSRFR